MRRFPAPPSQGGPSTPSSNRSAEAPMQYEWERPRQFPASPFATAAPGEEDEPARKRAHYEAMDVDTPPRPAVSFPPSATAPASDTFRFAPPAPPSLSEAPHEPAFDVEAFKPKEAFGLQDDEGEGDVSMAAADADEDGVPADKEMHLPVAVLGESGARRRKGGRGARRRSVDDSGASDDEVERHGHEHDGDGGFLGVLQTTAGRRKGDTQFSFQVHHHHGAAGHAVGGYGSPEGQQPERWMRKSTPYVLLGYLQFGSLAILAVMVLSLLALFLFTLKGDIDARFAAATLDLRRDNIECAKKFMENGCQAATRFPALEQSCNEWEECMQREVVVHGKARIIVETIADLVNSFFEVVSFKTMFFILMSLALTVYASTAALSLLASRASAASRSAASSSAPQHYGGYGAAPPPPPGFGYGMPYGGGGQGAPWVVESGGCERDERQLGLGPGPAGARDGRKSS
ncbi:hypothetical protein JCM3775_003935 [Rhodotorula graminis]